MTEITPTYYAEGTFTYEFTLEGAGFDALPSEAVAVPMTSNDDPLHYRNTGTLATVMTMTRISNTQVQFRASAEGGHPESSIGAILSHDRSEVFWVNNTNPLPEP